MPTYSCLTHFNSVYSVCVSVSACVCVTQYKRNQNTNPNPRGNNINAQPWSKSLFGRMAEAHRCQVAIRKVGGTLFTDLETCQILERDTGKQPQPRAPFWKYIFYVHTKSSPRDDSKGVCHCYPLSAAIRLAFFVSTFIFSFFNIKYGLIGKINQIQNIEIINLKHKRWRLLRLLPWSRWEWRRLGWTQWLLWL